MASPSQWTWVWANSVRLGKPSVQQYLRSRRVGHGLATEQKGYSYVHQNLGTTETFLRAVPVQATITSLDKWKFLLQDLGIFRVIWAHFEPPLPPLYLTSLREKAAVGFHQKAVASSVNTLRSQHGRIQLRTTKRKSRKISFVTGRAKNTQHFSLPVGESNPGLPRDRRGYSPLY